MFFSSYLSEETSSAALPACVNPIRTGRLISCTLALASLFCGPLHGFAAGGAELDKAHLVESYGKMPLSFEPNHGQTSSEVQWVARGPEYALFLSGHDAVLELNSIVPAREITDRPKIDSSAVRMNLLGAKAADRTNGEGQQAGTANYFTGNDPSKWQREVPNFERVRLSGVYPGIDLVYYGRQGRLEYDFVVAPGADPSKIALKFDGAEARLAGNGDLILPVAGTAREIRFDKPKVYQMKDGKREPIAGVFHLASDRTVSFTLGSYDRRRELVIDPTLLFAGSIATGNQQTIPTGMVIDSAGAMYLTGYTNDLTFPVTTGALQTNCQTYSTAAAANGFVRCGPSSNTSGFVTKISADGTSLVYSTYLHGGGGYEQGQSIAVDSLGDAYILGQTASNDFPVTSDAYQSLCQPYSDGNGGFTAQCDNFYDGGGTEYTVNGPNLFIAKLNPQGTALLYSTFFGGSAGVYPVGMGLDTSGNIYFASFVNGAESAGNLYPNNGQTPFPTTESSYQTAGHDLQTPALSKLSADGHTLMYSTFLGSPNPNGHGSNDQAFALGQNGVAFIGGFTDTSDFPTTAGSFKPTCGLNTNDTTFCFTNQGFVAAIDTTKSGTASLVYASYLGGEQQQTSNIPEQEVYGLAADANNDLFVTGYTSARDFPSTAGVFQPHCNDVTSDGNCNQTAFLSKINPAGSGFVWSTFFGDTRDGGPGSYGASIAFDSKGQVYLYGLSDDGGQISEVDPISTYTSGNKVFLATFSADATQLKFGTRFSGPSNNPISVAPIANGLAVDPAGSMYIVGYTGDNGAFGTTTGTYSTTATSGFNRPFFAKISAVTAQSATTLTITPSPAAAGQTITFAASGVGDGSNAAIPTGTVTITVSGVSPTPTVLGTITLDGTGNGRFSTNGLSSGTYSVLAAYSGDSNFEPSQSTVQTLAVTAPITQNLLLNPGAELGSIADWTVGGDGTPQVDTGTFDGGITPHTGSYDFLGYNGALDSLSQTVSIVAQGTGVTAAQVDGGTLTADVSFWEQGLSQGTPSDDGSVTLTFLDANGAAIGSPVTTSTVDSHDGTWANGLGTYAIPTGTRSITYTMNFMRNQGSDNDSFIDDNSLSIGTTTGLTLFPQSLHFGNVAVGSQSAPQTVTVTNQQTTTINIVQIMSELGANPKDFVQTNNCPGALTAGASCQVTVTFVPDGVGLKSAGIDLPDDAVPNDQFIRVDGIGTGGILQVNPGNLKTIAGNGTIGNTGDGAPAIMAELNQPNGVAFDPSGNLYIADDVANVVRKVDTAGNITTFAGTGTSGFTGDGGPATQAELSIPFSVASDAAGNIYIQDVGNYVIRKVTASTGIITTFAGTPGVPGHSGDGGPATQARFNNNQGARFDSAGNFYVPTCRGASIRKIDTAGNISTVAGNFTEGYSGDGGQATAAQLQCPSGVAIDTAGNLYIADASNNVIRKVNPQGIISTIAGSTSGVAGSTGDGGPATEALLSLPNDVVLDGVGNLYIADAANNRVRKIDTNGIITTAAGGLDNAGSAAVNTPLGLTTDTAGNVYFSDSGNGKIQEIFPQGTQPFPATQVGTTSAPQNLTLSNIGNVDVTLAPDGAFNLAGNSGDFALTAGGCAGGTVLAASGGSCALSITFTPTAVGQRTLTVQISDNALNSPQAFSIGGIGTAAGLITPTIMWVEPGSIPYGTPLSGTQLNAVATGANGVMVNGTFVYSPAAGTVLGAGEHPLSLTFTPTDAGYGPATGNNSITVTQFPPILTWPTPAAITTATPLSVTQLDAAATDINGVAVPGTYYYTPDVGSLLAAGTQKLTVTFVPNDTVDYIESVTTTRSIVVTQSAASATVTTLAISSGGTAITTLAAGSVVTLTATVTAGTAMVNPGQVAFCDATAATCTDIHLLGTAQLTTAGTATYRFVPGVGSHSYKAEFVGTGNDGASVSPPSPLTVTAGFATATSIMLSGIAGNYALTSTISSTASTDVAPTGMVSFLDTSNGNAVLGTATVGAATAAITFATPTAPATAFGVPVIADFNGDGVPDIAITQSGTTVGIFLGNGDGTFRAGAVITPSQGPAYLAVGDFNNDGKMDFVVASFATRSPHFIAGGVSVFLGNGDGTFNAGRTFAAATTDADYVSVGDFNGDGTLDVAVSDENSNLVTVLLGNGDGTFRMGSTNTSGTAPYASVVGDFNGDGKPDIAVTSVYGGSLSVPGNSVIVLLGNGDGTFTVAPSPTVGSTPAGIALGDFNGDGKLDLAVSNEVDGTVSVLLGKGDGTFGTGNTVSTGGNPQPIFSGDFNADGRVDLAVGDMAGNVVDILMGNGDGTFSLQASPATGTEPLFMATGDINGDGLTDIVSANVGMGSNTRSPSNQLTLLLPQVTHTTTASVSAISPLGSGPHQVIASYAGDTSYLASTSAAAGLIGITIAPVITWTPAVATIPYGTALGAQQLNATATAAGVAVPGTFVYTPAAGTVLMAGTQTLSVTFTPTSANYSVATGSATITVTQATTVISWAAPAMIPYGTALGVQQLNATAATAAGVAIPGAFVYTPAAGTVLAPGMQTLSVVFTPTDAVDYTTATASVQIVVGGLTLTSFTPVGVLLGSGDTTITLIGTGFVPTSMVMVNGAAVATAYVGPAMLTAVIPAALLRTMGSLAVTVVDPSIEAATVAQTFTVVPPTGAATLSGPATTDPGTQPTVTLSITNPYPLALTAEFSLAFASAGTTSVDDPSIQFSSGGRTFDYTVAANSTTVPPVELQAGTDAGTITITAKLMADGVDVTPAGLAPLVIVVPAVVPVISGTTITASGKTLTVVMHGFSNTREVSSATFDFTAATGDVLATPSVTIPATTIFGTWYGNPASVAYGSTFTYTQIFNTSEDAKTIGSVKVTLTNSVGASLVSTSTGP